MWSLRTCCKRIAREILLNYYPELSPSIEQLIKWANDNPTLLPPGTKMDRKELLPPYRKVIIASLTGVESQKKAKFICDPNRVRDWGVAPQVCSSYQTDFTLYSARGRHTATRFCKNSSLRLFTWEMDCIGIMGSRRHAHKDWTTMSRSTRFHWRC